MIQPAGYEDAVRVVRANMSPRATRMALLERFVEGTQYEGLPNFFAEDQKVPLLERAPCIVYPIVRSAIDSNVDLLLGDGRFPTLTSRPDEDSAFEDEGELPEDESDVLDKFVAQLHKASRFRAVARQVFAAAQGEGSGCAVLGVRAGTPFIETVKARWCEPKFDLARNVILLVIQYPFIETVKVNGAWKSKAKLYRRVITERQDITFVPADARADGNDDVDWVQDQSQTVDHGLGFCPVVWYAHMRGCVAVSDPDGRAIHEQLLDEIRAHDYVLSQRHRAALYAGDPQWTEAGVEKGFSPSPLTRKGHPTTLHGGKPSVDNPSTGSFREPERVRKGRKKGPGDVWQYDSPDVKVTLHTLPGDALKAIDEHAHDLRQKIAESLCVVFMDPENVKFAATVSGKALETLKQRQLDRCDQYRSDFGDMFIVPATSMLLRIVSRLGEGVRVPGVSKALPILQKFEVTEPIAAVVEPDSYRTVAA